MKKIISLILIVVMIMGTTLSFTNSEERDLNHTEFENIERFIEIESEEGQEILNNTKIHLDIVKAKIEKLKTIEEIKNTDEYKNYFKITFNESSEINIDKNGNLVKISLIGDESKNKLLVNNFRSCSSEDMSITDIVENNYIDDNYIEAGHSKITPTIIIKQYEEKLDCGGNDKFNSVRLIVDTSNNTVESLNIFNNEFVEPDIMITKEEAVNTATNVFESQQILEIPTVEIKTVRTNNFMDYLFKNAELKENDDIKMVYAVLSEGIELHVDVVNGEIVGGDTLKAYNGKAFGISELSDSKSNVNAAQIGMDKLGYSQWAGEILYKNQTDKIIESLNKNGFRALYFTGHGNTTVIGNGGNGWQLSYRGIPSGTGLKFVYLDACSTAGAAYWANAFGIYGGVSKKSIFVGWTETVYTTSASKFNGYFWAELNPNTSVSRAASKVPAGYYIPIGTIGDASYNGYANN